MDGNPSFLMSNLISYLSHTNGDVSDARTQMTQELCGQQETEPCLTTFFFFFLHACFRVEILDWSEAQEAAGGQCSLKERRWDGLRFEWDQGEVVRGGERGGASAVPQEDLQGRDLSFV